MTVSGGIDYYETYFEYPDLTKIHGKPDFKSLFQLRNDLKTNAQSVYSNLSDENHGHLALVLSPVQYAIITNVVFDCLFYPGVFIVPPGTTGLATTTMQEAHQEQLCIFCEAFGVEKALLQQIVKGVEAPYLAALRD